MTAKLVESGVEDLFVKEGREEDGPFESFSDYSYRGVAFGMLPMAVFRIVGHPGTQILLPVKGCKEVAAEEALALLEEVPDLRLVRRLVLLDQQHRMEPWLRQERQKPGLRILSEAVEDNDIYLYQPRFDRTTRDSVLHEWANLFRLRMPDVWRMFDLARSAEPRESFEAAGAGSENQSDEDWCSHLMACLVPGEAFRQPGDEPYDWVAFALLVAANPLRWCVLGKIIGDVLGSVPEGERSPGHSRYAALVEIIRKLAPAEARSQLREASDSDRIASSEAEELLRFLDGF